MGWTLLNKGSSVPNKIPSISNIAEDAILINTADAILFTKSKTEVRKFNSSKTKLTVVADKAARDALDLFNGEWVQYREAGKLHTEMYIDSDFQPLNIR